MTRGILGLNSSLPPWLHGLLEVCAKQYRSNSTRGVACCIIPPMATTTRANWIYLFHGEDDLSTREAVQGLVARMKDSPMWEFNVTFFDGDKLALGEMAGTCQTVPFLADKRLVVVTNLLSRLGEGGRASPRDDSPGEKAPRGSKKALLRGRAGAHSGCA